MWIGAGGQGTSPRGFMSLDGSWDFGVVRGFWAYVGGGSSSLGAVILGWGGPPTRSLMVFSTDPGVKDGLRPPASPAASRSLTPGPVEKKLAGYRGGGPGVARRKSCAFGLVLMGCEGGPSGHLPSTETMPFAHRENGL